MRPVPPPPPLMRAWAWAACVALLAAGCAAQASFGACYTSSSACCYELNFDQLPGYQNNASSYLASGTLLTPDLFAGAGVRVWLDSEVQCRDLGTVCPIVLVNSSTIAASATWGALRSPTEGLVAVVADSLVPFRPMRSATSGIDPYTVHLSFASVAKGAPACIASVRALRTYDIAYRISMTVSAYTANQTLLDTRSALWSSSLQTSRTNTIDLPLGVPQVQHLDVTFTGYGYAALAAVRFCYPNSLVDSCGVCGGDGSVCGVPFDAGPRPGGACINASMSNPVCRPGRYDPAMHCVPNLLNVSAEVCNGVDDDCDGVIDGGAPTVARSCGVGACNRTVYQCGGGGGAAFNATCVPGQPVPEVCNGIDDDCDGVVDNGHVCDQPVEGVPVVPIGVCVAGRLAGPAATRCVARFGYLTKEPNFNVSLPYPSDVNRLEFSALAGLWQPSTSEWPPSNYSAGSASMNAFNVELPACTGAAAAVAWTLGDGQGNYLRADLDANAAAPCETGNFSVQANLSLPLVPLVDDACVRRVNGTCTAALGYYNPNADVPTAYVPASAPTNYFYFTGGAAGPNPGRTPVAGMVAPPTVFFPGRVQRAYLAAWLCPTGAETLHWRLSSGPTSRTLEAIAGRMC